MKVKASELEKLKMVAGNEDKYNIIIDDGKVCQWVAIGWIELRDASKEDYKKFPEVIY